MNAALLRRLMGQPGAYVPLDALGEPPDRVRRELDELEAFGFALERHPVYGVAYRGPAESLCPDQIEEGLATVRVGRRVAVWNRVTSTNDLAARAAQSSANEGLVVLAEEQTAGRGRRGRKWTAPPRTSILASVLLFPPPALADPAWLTALGSVAVAELVTRWTGREALIKWPNDVRVAGAKVAGILVERGAGSVLGIGVNVNLRPEDFPTEIRATATSLAILRGERLDRSELVRDLIRTLDTHYEASRSSGPAPLAEAWRQRSEHLGRHARVETPGGWVVGRVIDIDLDAGLTLATREGNVQRVPRRDVRAVAKAEPDPSNGGELRSTSPADPS